MSAPNKGALQRLGRRVRFRILWIVLAFGAGASLTWYYRETIFGLLFAPAKGNLSPYGGLPIFTNPTEMLSATISLAMKGGMVAAFPVVVFSIYGLASPLLNHQQRRFAVIFLPAIFLCYIGGAAFAYFVMLPAGMRFLLHFGTGVAVPVIRVSEYLSLVTALLFWLGIVFEIPLVMFLLAKLKLVSRRRFARFRKYVPFAAFFLGAIITPTFDAVNQTMVAVPIIVLYEFGLFLAWLAEGGHRTLWQKARPKVAWALRRLWIVVVVVVLGMVVWQLVLSGMDGKLSIEDWDRFIKDWSRFWWAVYDASVKVLRALPGLASSTGAAGSRP